MTKNIYVNTIIKLLWCLRAKLHFEEVLELAVGIVFAVAVHLAVSRPFPINLKWSKTYNWTQKLTFYDAWEPNYTLKRSQNLLLALLLVLVSTQKHYDDFQSTLMVESCNWTPKSTLHDAREPSYALKRSLNMLLALLLMLVKFFQTKLVFSMDIDV